MQIIYLKNIKFIVVNQILRTIQQDIKNKIINPFTMTTLLPFITACYITSMIQTVILYSFLTKKKTKLSKESVPKKEEQLYSILIDFMPVVILLILLIVLLSISF